MKINSYIKIEGEMFIYDKIGKKIYVSFTPAELKALMKKLKEKSK